MTRRQSFLSNFGALVGTTAIAQLVTLATLPILARLYDPRDFGTFGVYAAYCTIVGGLGTGAFELAIPMSRSRLKIARLMLVATATLSLTAFAAGFALALLPESGGLSPLSPALVVPGAILVGIIHVGRLVSIRFQRLRPLAAAKLLQALVAAAVPMVLAMWGAIGLVAGHVGGLLAHAVVLATGNRSSFLARAVHKPLASGLKTARSNLKFPLFSLPAKASALAMRHFPVLLMQAVFGPAAAGLFLLADRAVTAPMTLLGTSAGRVYLADAAEAWRDPARTLRPVFMRSLKMQAALAVVPAAALLFFGPALFAVVLGDEWEPAGRYARLLTPLLFARLTVAPLEHTLVVADKLATRLKWELARGAMVILSMTIAVAAGAGADAVVLTFSLAATLGYLGLLFMLRRVVGATSRPVPVSPNDQSRRAVAIERILYASSVNLAAPTGPGVNEREFWIELVSRPEISSHAIVPTPAAALPELTTTSCTLIPESSAKNPLRWLRHQWAMYRAIRLRAQDFEPELIVLRITLLPLGAYAATRGTGVPYAVKTLGFGISRTAAAASGTRRPFAVAASTAHDAIVRRLLAGADAIDACTRRKTDRIVSVLGATAERVHRIDNAADTERFRPRSPAEHRPEAGLERLSRVIGYAGGRPWRRGCREAVTALPRILERVPGAGFVVLASEDERLQRLADDLAVSESCVFKGLLPFERVPSYVASFDVGVALMPAADTLLVGNANQKVRQYLACGVPVISSPGGELPLEDLGIGRIVEAGDIDGFVEAALWALRLDGDDRRMVSERARRFAVEELSVERTTTERLRIWSASLSRT